MQLSDVRLGRAFVAFAQRGRLRAEVAVCDAHKRRIVVATEGWQIGSTSPGAEADQPEQPVIRCRHPQRDTSDCQGGQPHDRRGEDAAPTLAAETRPPGQARKAGVNSVLGDEFGFPGRQLGQRASQAVRAPRRCCGVFVGAALHAQAQVFDAPAHGGQPSERGLEGGREKQRSVVATAEVAQLMVHNGSELIITEGLPQPS